MCLRGSSCLDALVEGNNQDAGCCCDCCYCANYGIIALLLFGLIFGVIYVVGRF